MEVEMKRGSRGWWGGWGVGGGEETYDVAYGYTHYGAVCSAPVSCVTQGLGIYG